MDVIYYTISSSFRQHNFVNSFLNGSSTVDSAILFGGFKGIWGGVGGERFRISMFHVVRFQFYSAVEG